MGSFLVFVGPRTGSRTTAEGSALAVSHVGLLSIGRLGLLSIESRGLLTVSEHAKVCTFLIHSLFVSFSVSFLFLLLLFERNGHDRNDSSPLPTTGGIYHAAWNDGNGF